MLNMMWAIEDRRLTGSRGLQRPIATNRVSSDAPSTISGVAIGRKISTFVVALPRNAIADERQAR